MRCQYSGLPVHYCKVSDLCDCFDYPEADAAALETIAKRDARPPLPPTDPAAYQWPDIDIAGEENERRNREWWSE